jgi:predicted RNA-binding protein with PIN domain
MKLLVDGYNLLHASGVFGHPDDEPSLETARRALLGFLAQHLNERERPRTIVVFDGKDAPKGLPEVGSFEKIQILFSRRKQSADDLIAELIAVEKQPRELMVISSDHGVQRSARQRGIVSQDSEAWIRELRANRQATTTAEEKQIFAESSAEQQRWLRVFSAPNRRDPS